MRLEADSSGERERWSGLLARWQERGDVEALEELLRLLRNELRTRLRAKGVDPNDPEYDISDYMQSALGRYLVKRPDFEHPRQFLEWLVKTAVRRLYDVERRGRRVERGEPPPEDCRVTGRGADPEEIDLVELEEHLAGLPDRERAVLERRFLRGKSAREVAEELGIHRQRVSELTMRALGRLRRSLGA